MDAEQPPLSVAARLKRRYAWYKSMLQVNNVHVGRLVERLGDTVRMDGMRFSVDCPLVSTPHKSTLAFGLHEIEERALIRKWLRPDHPVVEFGGGLGVVSCLINSRLTRPDDHVVVEANPIMVPVLERNRDMNGCGFSVLNRALAYDADTVTLNIDSEFVGSSAKGAATGRTVDVKTVRLSDILQSRHWADVTVVADIEGLEKELIENEILSSQDIGAVMFEMHPKHLGRDGVEALIGKMKSAGFETREEIGDSIYMHRIS